MALPKQVKYSTTKVALPSKSNVELKIHPFTGHEEKLFLMMKAAKEDAAKIQDATLQVIQNCLVDPPPGFSIKDLTLFDIEWLFLQLHAISIDSTIEFVYNNSENKEKELCKDNCPNEIRIQIPISTIKVQFPTENLSKIILYDNDDIGMLGLKLSYPKAELVPMISNLIKEDEAVQLEELTFACLEYFFDKEKTYIPDRNDETEVIETKKMISDFTFEQRKKIRLFFENTPTLKHSFEVKCPKCGNHETLTVQGLNDFFL